jgi:hypothetical protein
MNLKVQLETSRTIYMPGQRVSGFVHLNLSHSALVKLFRVRLTGTIYTHLNQNDTSLTNRVNSLILFKDIINLENTNGQEIVELEAGSRSCFFDFRIPVAALPPTFEGFYGNVEYSVTAVFITAHLQKRIVSVPITIPCTSSIEDTPHPFSTELVIPARKWWLYVGHVDILASLSQCAFYLEDSITLLLDITNHSNLPVTIKSITLKQKCTYKIAYENRGPKTERLHSFKYSEAVLPHFKKIIRSIDIPVPDASVFSSSFITPLIIVSHFISVKIKVGGKLGKLSIPITLGGFPWHAMDLDGLISVSTLPRYSLKDPMDDESRQLMSLNSKDSGVELRNFSCSDY